MPNKKITEFNAVSTPSGTDVIPIVNGGETKKITLDNLSLFISSNLSGGVQNFIQPSDVITIPPNFQWLVYGDLLLNGGTLNNEGDLVIINGSLINSGGTYNSSGGTISLITLDTTVTTSKFVIVTGITANTPLIITHGLGTTDIIISVVDLNTGQKIIVNEYNYNMNNVTIESTQTLINIKITIIG